MQREYRLAATATYLVVQQIEVLLQDGCYVICGADNSKIYFYTHLQK